MYIYIGCILLVSSANTVLYLTPVEQLIVTYKNWKNLLMLLEPDVVVPIQKRYSENISVFQSNMYIIIYRRN